MLNFNGSKLQILAGNILHEEQSIYSNGEQKLMHAQLKNGSTC